MSLGKRHIGRRVAGVGVAAALMMLGLEAPAFAAPPTVTAIAPTSGPEDCIAVVTGTAFTDSPVGDTTVTFDGAADVVATDFSIASATEIWVRVPDLVEGASYTILIENNGGTASGGTFLATTGGCAPTIASFTPTCGLSGTTVVITGTNLLGGTDPTVAADQAEVRFFDYVAATTEADHTVPNVDSSTQISVLVPSGAADGPIRVETDVATLGFSAAPFLVPPPDCLPPGGGPEHARSITLKMKKNGRASGIVSSTEDPAFTDCVASVPVKIRFKKKGGNWKNAGRTSTTLEGNYAVKTKGKPGRYKAIAVKVNIGDPVTDVCLKARSPIRKIKK